MKKKFDFSTEEENYQLIAVKKMKHLKPLFVLVFDKESNTMNDEY